MISHFWWQFCLAACNMIPHLHLSHSPKLALYASVWFLIDVTSHMVLQINPQIKGKFAKTTCISFSYRTLELAHVLFKDARFKSVSIAFWWCLHFIFLFLNFQSIAILAYTGFHHGSIRKTWSMFSMTKIQMVAQMLSRQGSEITQHADKWWHGLQVLHSHVLGHKIFCSLWCILLSILWILRFFRTIYSMFFF